MYHDWLGVKKLLARAKTICEAGGDWEHKNKLKVRAGSVGRSIGAGLVGASSLARAPALVCSPWRCSSGPLHSCARKVRAHTRRSLTGIMRLWLRAACVCAYCVHQVYEGVAAMHSRDFKRAAELLLDSIATFTT